VLSVTLLAAVIPSGYVLTVGDLMGEWRGNNEWGLHNGASHLYSAQRPLLDAFVHGGGLWCEHTMGMHDTPNNFFACAAGALPLTVNGHTITLTRQPQDDPWLVGMVLRYTMVAPHYVDLDVSLTPTDAAKFAPSGVAVFMSASYMATTLDPAINFRGLTGPNQPETWIRADATQPDKLGHLYDTGGGIYTHLDAFPLPVVKGNQAYFNLNSFPWPRFTQPFYFGRTQGMVWELMFDRGWTPVDEIRFPLFEFPIKGTTPQAYNPAWDWQYVIHNVVAGQTYRYCGRAIWKPFVSQEDAQSEYDNWRAVTPQCS